MKTFSVISVFFVSLALQCLAGETLVDELLASYAEIKTVSCEIRKITESSEGKLRFLSRVYYEKPDRIHVQNISPLKRTIVSDGSRFYSYVEGAPKGFSKPVEDLDEKMSISLRKVPGTAMDHLLRLKGIHETNLKPQQDFPVRKGYKTKKVFVVLSLNTEGRLARIEFYNTASMKQEIAQYDYSHFKEVLSDVWIPCLHKSTAIIGDIKSGETVRVTNLVVNQSIAKSLFVAAPFFQNVEFVDNFEDIYGSSYSPQRR